MPRPASRHTRALPLALLLPLVAGCLTSGVPPDDGGSAGEGDLDLSALSQPVFPGLVKAPLAVLAPDGKRLSTHTYLPELPEGERVPALLVLSPYFSNGASTSGVHNADEAQSGFYKELLELFVPRGYAVVLSSVRGTGFSEGCFTIGGPTESKDSVAVVEAILAEPWSNGAIAVLGKSYVGTTANDILLEGHPAVRTVVPVSAISDFYRYNFLHGVPINPQGYTFNFYYERDVAMVPPHAEPGFETAHLLGEEATCDHAETQLGGLHSAATGDKHGYWQARDFNREVDGIASRASVFLVHGLQDWNVKPDHILPWLDHLQDRVPTKVWLGQWAHDYPNQNRFREEWSRGDWNLTLLRWFDHWLKGIDSGILQEPMVDVQDDQGVWRKEGRWPPAHAEEARLFLAPGALQEAPGSGATSWRDLGLPLPKPPQAGADHYALFVSEPLAEDLRISGEALLTLDLQHGAPSGTVVATLWRLAPDGTAERINYGYMDLEHRNGLASSQPVTPGARFTLEVPFIPQEDVVPAGARLALTLAGNDSPVCVYDTLLTFRCAPAPGYDDPGPLTQPLPSGGTTTVHHGEASVLRLGVVGDIADRVFAPTAEHPGAGDEDAGA